MKAKNLVLVLAGVLGFLSCQKNEIVVMKANNSDGISQVYKLKSAQSGESFGTPAIITFNGVEYTIEDNSVFSYQVTSGAKPALSHWNLNIMPSLFAEGVAEVILLASSDPTTVYGKDGSLKKFPGYADLTWLKFDKPYKDGETRLVTFTLKGHWYVGDILAISKGGNTCIPEYLPGPVQISIPTIVTLEATLIGSNSAEVGGRITYDNGANITARGVCWSISSNPTILNYKTTVGTGTGEFTSSLTNLEIATTYYARAYASIGIGTYYGKKISFKTTPVR